MWKSKLKSSRVELTQFLLASAVLVLLLEMLTFSLPTVQGKSASGIGFRDFDFDDSSSSNLIHLNLSSSGMPFKPRSDFAGGSSSGYAGAGAGAGVGLGGSYGHFGNGWAQSSGYPAYTPYSGKGSGWKRQAIVDYDDDDSVTDIQDLGLLGLLGLIGLPGMAGLKGLKAAGLLALPWIPILLLLPFAPLLLLTLLLFIPVPIVTTGRGSQSSNSKPMAIKEVLKDTLDDLVAKLPSDLTKINFDFLKKKKGKQGANKATGSGNDDLGIEYNSI